MIFLILLSFWLRLPHVEGIKQRRIFNLLRHQGTCLMSFF